MNQRILLSLFAIVALAACEPKPPTSSFHNRGGPDALLDVSSEVVNLSVADPQALTELSSWIKGDQPTRAELYCNEGDMRCTQARRILDLHGVPTMTVPSGEYTVALVYERLLARDCKQRYIDNSRRGNFYNTNHPAFGCSISANIVQHVTDKQAFINPSTTDPTPGRGPVTQYNRAYIQRPPVQPYAVDQSLAAESRTE